MTPAARLSAAAEILDALAAGRAPAETVLKAWGRAHRFAGAKDRRAIADRVYACARTRARLAWAMGREDGRGLVLGSLALIDGLSVEEISALCSGDAHAPAPLTAQERDRLSARDPGSPPGWVCAGLPAFVARDMQLRCGEAWVAEAEALMLPRAPIDLRVNRALTGVEAVEAALGEAGLSPGRTPIALNGLRLSAEPPPNLARLAAFRGGGFEIQDEGSQIAAGLVGAGPGQTVVDYCAGGGGKTLALAEAMEGRGRLIACDVDPRRLEAIAPRLARARVGAERVLLDGPDALSGVEGRAQRVLVDAPCSGSGTWRRRPEEAHRLTEAEVERLHRLQVDILDRAQRLVAPGGRLIYVTCSILTRENEDSATAFAGSHPAFRPLAIDVLLPDAPLTDLGRRRLAELAGAGAALRLSPWATGTDGFFIAAFERTA